MLSLTEKDKDSINKETGKYSVRGFFDDMEFIERKFGKEKLEELKKELGKSNINVFDYKKTKEVPISSYLTFLVLSRKFFNLSDEEMREMGRDSAKASFIIKFASRFLISIKTICNNSQEAWERYHKNAGSFKVAQVDEENKKIVTEIHNFKGHPDYCLHLEGFFEQLIFFVTGKKGRCREESCALKDDSEVHRFVVTWE